MVVQWVITNHWPFYLYWRLDQVNWMLYYVIQITSNFHSCSNCGQSCLGIQRSSKKFTEFVYKLDHPPDFDVLYPERIVFCTLGCWRDLSLDFGDMGEGSRFVSCLLSSPTVRSFGSLFLPFTEYWSGSKIVKQLQNFQSKWAESKFILTIAGSLSMPYTETDIMNCLKHHGNDWCIILVGKDISLNYDDEKHGFVFPKTFNR